MGIEFDRPWHPPDWTATFDDPEAASRFAAEGWIDWQYRRHVVVARTARTVVLRPV